MLKDLPSPDDLRKVLRYDLLTGRMFWRERDASLFSDAGYGGAIGEAARWNARFAGAEAFLEEDQGYRRGKVFGVRIRAHRAAWAIETGEWPDCAIDHINCDRSDNRWENLRLATSAENARNRRISTRNLSGFKGVSWDDRTKSWVALVAARIGRFDTPEEAHNACVVARDYLHGTFARSR